MGSVYTTTIHEEQQSSTILLRKQVKFCDEAKTHLIANGELNPESWYDINMLKAAYREDVIEYLKEVQKRQEGGSDDDESDSADDSRRSVQKEPVCERGLEQYNPGQLQLRRRTRAVFSEAILKRVNELKQCDHMSPNDKVEALAKKAMRLAEKSRSSAHCIAMKDAMEAKMIHVESFSEINRKEFATMIRRDSTKTQSKSCKARAA